MRVLKKYKPFLKYLLAVIVLLSLYFTCCYLLRQKDGFDNMSGEKDCTFVSSRGILFSCDKYPKNPISSSSSIGDIDLSTIQDGETLYIQGSAIKEFSQKLDQIPNRFILVSGDCDESIPNDVFTDMEFRNFIDSDKIIHWYTQNCVGNHPKLSAIPIGLDYHTRSTPGTVSERWGHITTPKEQETEIQSLINVSKPFYDRTIKAYANFQFNMSEEYTQDRVDAKNKLDIVCVSYEPNHTKTRLESFQRQMEYAFVISPHGRGLDCHRTWEALVLGCIPIVKSSTNDPLYNELPVLVVNDWSDVKQELLIDTIQKYKGRDFKYDKLRLKYWIDIIRSR